MPKRQRNEYGSGTVRKRGQTWEGRFYPDDGGPRVEVTVGKVKDLPTETKARKRLREMMGVYERPKKGAGITIAVLCDKYVAYRETDPDLAPNSLEAIKSHIRTHIKPEFGSRLAGDVTGDDLARFQAAKLKVRAVESVKHYMSTFHSVLEYGVQTLKVLASNVAKEVKRIKGGGSLELAILNTEEIMQICEGAKGDAVHGEQDAVMIFVASRSGLRQGELISLRVHSLDFDNGWIRVLTSYDRVAKNHKRPKGRAFRALPMSDEVKAVLRPHVEGKGPNDFVFGHPETGHELDASKLLKRFKAAVIWAGVRQEDWEKRTYRTSRGRSKQRWFTPLRFHDLRHAFGTWCAMRGIPSYIIEKWCGWADKETMDIYLHYAPAGFELDLLNAAAQVAPNSPISLAIARHS
jgi:integrase